MAVIMVVMIVVVMIMVVIVDFEEVGLDFEDAVEIEGVGAPARRRSPRCISARDAASHKD